MEHIRAKYSSNDRLSIAATQKLGNKRGLHKASCNGIVGIPKNEAAHSSHQYRLQSILLEALSYSAMFWDNLQ